MSEPDEYVFEPDLPPGAGAEAALAKLAERLYWNMERMDPGIDTPDWPGLTDRQRDFYGRLVSDLIAFEGLIEMVRRAN